MTTSAVPALIDAIVSTARTALPDLLVHDGAGNTESPGDYLMVGIEDPEIPGFASSASTQQGFATVGLDADRDEEGDIFCSALSWDGGSDEIAQKRVRDAVYATTAQVEAMLRANQSLGVDSVLWTSFGTVSALNQAQDDYGVAARVLFAIHFRARLLYA